MAIAFRNAQGAIDDTAASSITVNKPGLLAVNDLMLAIVSIHDATTLEAISTPSGWTLIGSQSQGNNRSYWFWKVSDSSDVAASNFTFGTAGGSNDNTAVTLIAYIGVDTTTPIDVHTLSSGVETSVGTVDVTGVTTTVAGCQIVATGTINSTDTWSQTQPSGYTEVGHLFGDIDVDMITFHKSQVSAGATGSVTFSVSTISSPTWVGGVVALAPAGPSSGNQSQLINGGLINHSRVHSGLIS